MRQLSLKLKSSGAEEHAYNMYDYNFNTSFFVEEGKEMKMKSQKHLPSNKPSDVYSKMSPRGSLGLRRSASQH